MAKVSFKEIKEARTTGDEEEVISSSHLRLKKFECRRYYAFRWWPCLRYSGYSWLTALDAALGIGVPRGHYCRNLWSESSGEQLFTRNS